MPVNGHFYFDDRKFQKVSGRPDLYWDARTASLGVLYHILCAFGGNLKSLILISAPHSGGRRTAFHLPLFSGPSTESPAPSDANAGGSQDVKAATPGVNQVRTIGQKPANLAHDGATICRLLLSVRWWLCAESQSQVTRLICAC
jgi:hypothetical protein